MTPMLKLGTAISPPLLARDSGPGLRWLLFLQGCRRPCTEQCLNPHYLDPKGGRSYSLAEIELQCAQMAIGTYGKVEGLTILGGEPTDQAEALLPILEASQKLGLSVMLYSGKPLSWFQLRQNAKAKALLDFVDILVDGPFLPFLAKEGLRWRGSTNQFIRCLSSRYSPGELPRLQAEAGVTVTIPVSGRPIFSGLQDRKVAASVEDILEL